MGETGQKLQELRGGDIESSPPSRLTRKRPLVTKIVMHIPRVGLTVKHRPRFDFKGVGLESLLGTEGDEGKQAIALLDYGATLLIFAGVFLLKRR